MNRIKKRLKKFFGIKPKKYLILQFKDPVHPLRKYKVIEETETTYVAQGLIFLFGVPFRDWEQRILKTNPKIKEVVLE